MPDKLVLGAGAALVDLLIEESDDFLTDLNSPKGGMTLVDGARIDEIVSKSSSKPAIVPGGSACNTIVGISSLGGKSKFAGRCGNDETAEVFVGGLKKAGVESRIGRSDTSTGRVLSVVTPDGQRTMFTCLGASQELSGQDISDELFENCAIVHLEGYLLYNKDVVNTIIERSRKFGCRLCIDLGAFQVVKENREYLGEIIASQVDILIANEDEARAYTGQNEEESLEHFAGIADIAVVKKGGKGALIASGKERISLEAMPASVLDTTGAGDLWAAGFLYGLTHGYNLEKAGKLGSATAAQVIQVLGAIIPHDGWEKIKMLQSELENGRV